MRIPEKAAWTFESKEVADNFDKHVNEQLPWYGLATNMVAHIINHYLPKGGTLYDIGASTGNITNSVRDTIETRDVTVYAIEPSKEMAAIYSGLGELITKQVQDVDIKRFDVAVMFLTMMFVPVKEREALLNDLYENLNIGGCIIIFDKSESIGGYLSTVLYRLTLAEKIAQGATPDNILKKELSLSGVQVPYTCKHVNATKIFQFGEFSGWVIEKKE